ncbi:MAG TPA: dihydrofolate reductase [Flavobacteriales bacterium]|nr:dihydrofolate reductase [Flavobacteriales bacterium]
MIVSAIAAVADNGTIGRNGDLPWHLPDDMKYFQHVTMGHPVITGRKNYESIPPKYRPLKGRLNLVVTHDQGYSAPGAVVVTSLRDALTRAEQEGTAEIFVIGGGQIYREALANDLVDRLYLTLVHADIEGDTHFPSVDPADWVERSRERREADERHAHPFSLVVLDRRR